MSHEMSRRRWLKTTALGSSFASWLPALATDLAEQKERKRACILLWMAGGPSQIDTLDPKPNHENGGEFKPIQTSVPGILLGEHLPKLAQQMKHVSLIRSMTTKEGDHSRGTFLMRTGHPPLGPVKYPSIGSLFSKELGKGRDAELPNYISVLPYRVLNPGAFGPGFLGPEHAPLVVGEAAPGQGGDDYEQSLKVRNLDRAAGVTRAEADERLKMLNELESTYVSARPSDFAQSHLSAYQRAVRMMRSKAIKAFSLDGEPAKLRDAYGRNRFGQGCLLARRLVERGVPFVEVSLNGVGNQGGLGWDTHQNNFPRVKSLCEVLDSGWATLISDLEDRGLLESTMIVWMGEFGRTPRINRSNGRDHFPGAWSAALAGGGLQTGQTIGATSVDGMQVEDRPVPIDDFIATLCKGLKLDPAKQNMSNVGRPIRLAELSAQPIEELF